MAELKKKKNFREKLTDKNREIGLRKKYDLKSPAEPKKVYEKNDVRKDPGKSPKAADASKVPGTGKSPVDVVKNPYHKETGKMSSVGSYGSSKAPAKKANPNLGIGENQRSSVAKKVNPNLGIGENFKAPSLKKGPSLGIGENFKTPSKPDSASPAAKSTRVAPNPPSRAQKGPASGEMSYKAPGPSQTRGSVVSAYDRQLQNSVDKGSASEAVSRYVAKKKRG